MTYNFGTTKKVTNTYNTENTGGCRRYSRRKERKGGGNGGAGGGGGGGGGDVGGGGGSSGGGSNVVRDSKTCKYKIKSHGRQK